MEKNSHFKLTKVKFNNFLLVKKISSLSFVGLLILSSSSVIGQITPISVHYLNDSLNLSSNSFNPIILSNDSQGIFYLENIYNNSLKFKSQSESKSQSYILTLNNFNLNDGLKHSIVKIKDKIIILNRSNNSIQCIDINRSIKKFDTTNLHEFQLEQNEKIIRIETDNQNVYLVSYDFKTRNQKFYIFKPENNSLELVYSNFNPFLEIFYSDDNISNYSFCNNKLIVSDFYSGQSVIIDIKNSHIDTINLPLILNEKRPSLGTFIRLKNNYDKSPTMSNYDSLFNLVNNYNHVVNSFLLDDSTILISVRFINQNSASFDIICLDLLSQKTIFKQRRITIKSISESVNLYNLPIYIGNEELNYIGDGVIYVYKEMPRLNKYDWREFLNQMNDLNSAKIGTFIMYKYLPELK